MMKLAAHMITGIILVGMIHTTKAQTILIDNFDTGPQVISPRDPSSGTGTRVQTGSMLGGFRQVKHIVQQLPSPPTSLGRKGVYNIIGGHLIVEDGVRVASRLEVSYGFDKEDNLIPLNLDLSNALANGKMKLHFHSLDMINQVDAIIQLVTPSREIFQLSKPITPPVAGSFTIAFPLSAFRSGSQGKPPTKNDLKSIDYITLILQDGGTGGNDFAIDVFDISFN
ncbi:MAG: hypothetical protein IT524_10165 [Nitrosomonas sp.]|nr:hypothetical protein [Nitrosomonas sp.]